MDLVKQRTKKPILTHQLTPGRGEGCSAQVEKRGREKKKLGPNNRVRRKKTKIDSPAGVPF